MKFRTGWQLIENMPGRVKRRFEPQDVHILGRLLVFLLFCGEVPKKLSSNRQVALKIALLSVFWAYASHLAGFAELHFDQLSISLMKAQLTARCPLGSLEVLDLFFKKYVEIAVCTRTRYVKLVK